MADSPPSPAPPLRVHIGAFAHAGQNLGLDPLASAERFADNLRPALAEELPHSRIEVLVDESADAPRIRVEVLASVDQETRARLELEVEGTANAVRSATEWAVWG